MAGQLQVDTAGTYTFATSEPDATEGSRLYVDDKLIMDRTYPTTVLGSGPVAYWRMGTTPNSPDTRVTDVSGLGHDATLSGSYRINPKGMTPDDDNRGVTYSGGSASAPNSAALNLTGDMSVEMWVNPVTLAANTDQILLTKYVAGTSDPLPWDVVLLKDGRPAFNQNSAAGAHYAVSVADGAVPYDRWSHLVITRKANVVTYYINGVKAGATTMTMAPAANTGPVTIGGRAGGPPSHANIDNAAVYNRALSDAEIATHAGTDRGVGTSYQAGNPPTATLTAGAHRIRLDTVHRGPTAGQGVTGSGVNLTWRTTGGPVAVPAGALTPDYGLATSTTVHDSAGVPDQVASTSYTGGGLDPAYGLATASTDGAGAAGLTETTTYEAPGTGFLRRVAKTMPGGAVSTDAYYAVGETRANPCVAGSAAVDQGGMVRSHRDPTPAVGDPVVSEVVYDTRGRVVASETAGGWTCTSFDQRGRPVRTTTPGTASTNARTETAVFAVNGDPRVTSVGDEQGTVTTVTDLVGRVVSYTDVWGTRTTDTYTLDGRTTAETVTPPSAADPAQTTTFGYDSAGRVVSQSLSGVTKPLAAVTYTAVGEIGSVAYANGAALSSIARDGQGGATGLTWRPAPGGIDVVSAVSRTRSGRIVDESLGGVDPNPGGPNYVYDGVGRLTRAVVAGHTYDYDFTSTTTTGCAAGSSATAGRNSNRVAVTDTPTTGAVTRTGFCFDAADRLLGTTGTGDAAGITGVGYDPEGDTTGWTAADGAVTALGWDAGHRNTTASVSNSPDPAQDAAVAYARDAGDRVVARATTTTAGSSTLRYAFTGDGDTPDLVLDAGNRVLTRTIALPGGVLYDQPGQGAPPTTTAGGASVPAAPSWSCPSIRGDIALLWTDAGIQTGPLHTYTPDGQPLTPTGVPDPDAGPDTQPGDTDTGWLGQHQKDLDHAGGLNLIQMGARPYTPLLARFLTVDPVEGGTANAYTYVTDPINDTDLTGMFGWRSALKSAGRWAGKHKLDIALTAASFIPVVGQVAWAYRGVRVAAWIGRSQKFGTASRLFGNTSLGAKSAGLLNRKGLWGGGRIGWSVRPHSGGGMMTSFRISHPRIPWNKGHIHLMRGWKL